MPCRACLTLILWFIGALIFAHYPATFANYAATYAGLASVMIVLIFLHDRRDLHHRRRTQRGTPEIPVWGDLLHNFLSGQGQGQKPSKPDEVANIVRRDASGS